MYRRPVLKEYAESLRKKLRALLDKKQAELEDKHRERERIRNMDPTDPGNPFREYQHLLELEPDELCTALTELTHNEYRAIPHDIKRVLFLRSRAP